MRKYWLLTLCLSWLLAFALGNGVLAQDKQELTQTKVPLEQLLKRDGTLNLNRGFRGSLDPTGWQMTTGPNGEPRFVPSNAAQQTAGAAQLMAVPGDERWDDRFFLNGLSGNVGSLAVDGGGNIYAGGGFISANGISASHIAKWNGNSWSALGNGVNGYVYALAVDGSDNVYTGGWGIGNNYIGKWNGSSWSTLGSGVNSYVFALAVDGNGNIYAGGDFTTAGGISANRIAKWNGTSWSALGSGMNAPVRALAVDGSGNVYAGGDFTTAGGVTANRIAKWDGASWSALGTGMSGGGLPTVGSLAIDASGNVYAGGGFIFAGGVFANRIAKWNGTNWSALADGINFNPLDPFPTTYTGIFVFDLAVDNNGNVYAGGAFSKAGGVTANNIAKWNGSTWSALGASPNGRINALVLEGNGNVYVGGDFYSGVGGNNANYIAKWDGSGWSTLGANGSGIIGLNITALTVDGNSNVYAGGNFTAAGGASAKYIAEWDGSGWLALGSGMDGQVNALIANGSNVYAGGSFVNAGGSFASRIAKWNGSNWSALGSGVSYTVTALAIDGDNLYAGGWFTSAGSIGANHVAKWHGSSWSALGSGVNGNVYALAADGNGNLYVGGLFSVAGSVSANNIAKWDGSGWSALGGGTNSAVSALAVEGSNVYAGGYFTIAGGSSANYIAKWNGSSWSALSSGMNGNVSALILDGSGNLYASGGFSTAGGVNARYIAKWNGSTWSALGSGMNSAVVALALDGSGSLYAGGYFATASDKMSFRFGRYFLNQPPTVYAGGSYTVNEGASVTVSASGNDPENGILTYAWDLDNNGSFETAGQSVTFLAANLDGPSSHIIKAQVTDNDGLTAIAQATVNVLNVAPTATLTGTPSTILVGQSATWAFSNQFDPSAADMTIGFTYLFDCTNDGTFEISDASHVCAYPVSGTINAKGRIKDKDGGFTDYMVQVEVLTPQEAVQNLIEQVRALNKPEGNGLIGKLQVVINRLDNNRIDKAIEMLQQFIDQVEDFIGNRTLTEEEGRPLIDAANAVIAALSNSAQTVGHKKDAGDGLTAIVSVLPTGFQLEQNSPNPFNPVTTIQFSVPCERYVRLKVYNSFGAEVATLIDRQVAAGTYKVNWDASRLASGFYLYRLEAEGFAQTKKLLLMK